MENIMTDVSPLLYLITPSSFDVPSFTEQFKQACEGGRIGALQLRLKEEGSEDTPASESKFIEASRALLPICHEYDIAFILNDRPELVEKTGADGVHVGLSDAFLDKGGLNAIRRKLGDNKIIGTSCYASRDFAMQSGEQGADYVSFGAFYHTETKTPKGHPEPDMLTWWSTFTEIPCCAIGGIKPDNCAPLVKAGADFICVVTGVWNHPQGAKAAVAEYNKVIADAIK